MRKLNVEKEIKSKWGAEKASPDIDKNLLDGIDFLKDIKGGVVQEIAEDYDFTDEEVFEDFDAGYTPEQKNARDLEMETKYSRFVSMVLARGSQMLSFVLDGEAIFRWLLHKKRFNDIAKFKKLIGRDNFAVMMRKWYDYNYLYRLLVFHRQYDVLAYLINTKTITVRFVNDIKSRAKNTIKNKTSIINGFLEVEKLLDEPFKEIFAKHFDDAVEEMFGIGSTKSLLRKEQGRSSSEFVRLRRKLVKVIESNQKLMEILDGKPISKVDREVLKTVDRYLIYKYENDGKVLEVRKIPFEDKEIGGKVFRTRVKKGVTVDYGNGVIGVKPYKIDREGLERELSGCDAVKVEKSPLKSVKIAKISLKKRKRGRKKSKKGVKKPMLKNVK
jgi:hypothetical protein